MSFIGTYSFDQNHIHHFAYRLPALTNHTKKCSLSRRRNGSRDGKSTNCLGFPRFVGETVFSIYANDARRGGEGKL